MDKKIRIIIISIILILILSVLLINQMKYRNDELYAVNLKNKIDKNLVSILVSDGSDNYTKYDGDSFPSNTEYTYNSELSKCQDNNGNVIEGILNYDETTGKVSIRTKKTTYCYLYFDWIPPKPLNDKLIASGELWQSGLEGDGYRYTGTGIICTYDNGSYIGVAINQTTTPSCPMLYNYTRTRVSNGTTTNYTYQTRCPSNTSTYTYDCTELAGTVNSESINTVPNNFICFGTTSLTECKANEEKYMYRIIGIFPDETGEQHLKLIKYKQIGAYGWHNDYSIDTSWEDSNLYKGLNGISGGSYGNLFIGNTTYDYLQDTWLNKIVDWKWTATNTLTESNSGPSYFDNLPSEIYLHEMNKSTKTNAIGTWTYPVAKIGLIYVSDYALSLENSSLTMTSSSNNETLKTSWMYQSNNDITASTGEWSITRYGSIRRGDFTAWCVNDVGSVASNMVDYPNGVSPVFYLESNVTTFDGNGEYGNPYLIAE